LEAKVARIVDVAQSAGLQLDAGRARLYVDLVFHSLSEAARRALRNMNPAKYEYQSDFARHYAAPIPTLDAIGERLLTAPTLAEAVGELG
jgi:hypothetical protein